MQDQVAAACQALMEKHADFWLLAAITDYSFEEGTRNRSLQEPVRRLEAAGTSAHVLADLRGGINGTLEQELSLAFTGAAISSNKSRVPDLLVERAGTRVAIEVKLIYDLTYTKYYRSAAEDHVKLARYVAANPGTEAFAVAFLVQLPSMDYPAGRWYGRAKLSRARWDQLVRAGAQNQLDELCTRVGSRPTAGDPVPVMTQFNPAASKNALAAAARWFADVFEPSTSWCFDPSGHLENAAVGCAIWRVA